MHTYMCTIQVPIGYYFQNQEEITIIDYDKFMFIPFLHKFSYT